MGIIKKFIPLDNLKNEYFLEVNTNSSIEEELVITVYTCDKDFNIINKSFGSVFINSKKIDFSNISKENNKFTIKNSGHIHIFIDQETNYEDFYFCLHLNKNIYKEEVYYFAYNYDKENKSLKNNTLSNTKILNSDRTSFMLLRTNPKLTGNIKLVIDSNDKMYIDTFEVNSTLSNKNYKHKSVSNLSSYGNDIRNIFSKISKKDLFDVPNNAYSLFDTHNNISNQYIDMYNYGVKTNTNRLYPENFAMLAPLYLNEELPDFFVIFKMNGPTNEDVKTYNATNKLKYFLNNGTIIKSYDLRTNTSIGSYLNDIIKNNNIFNTSILLSMNELNPNKWGGISIDRGIHTIVSESGFNIAKIKNQVAYDNYVTGGFERNGIVNSHLINLEFLFNDEGSEDFTINRYFGLYISNTLLSKILFKDENTILLNNNETISIDDFVEKYKLNTEDYIFNITTQGNDFIRIKTSQDLKNLYHYFNDNKINYNNIQSTNIHKNEMNDKRFSMLVNINEPLHPGEHLRIIDKINKNVYEVIISKVDLNKYNNIDDFYNYENCPIVNFSNEVTINRNIAPGYNNDNDNILFYENTYIKDNIIKKQINLINKSFHSILPKEIEVINDDNSLYISSNNNNLSFERISSQIIYTSEEDKIEDELKNNITFFGKVIDGVFLKPSISDLSSFDYIYQPISFETWANRYAYIVDFVEKEEDCYIFNIPSEAVKNISSLTYAKINDEYIQISDFVLNYYKNIEDDLSIDQIKTNVLESNEKGKSIIKIKTNNTLLGKVKLYNIVEFNFNVAGINPVKDFNFNVLDNTNVFEHLNYYTKIEGKDIYDNDYYVEDNSLYTINKLRQGTNSCENIFNYISLTNNNSYVDVSSFEEKINDLYNSSKRKLDIPLVTPINCKWKMCGKDILNDEIKSTTIFKFEDNSGYKSYRLNIDNKLNMFGFASDSSKDEKLYINNNIFNSINGISLRENILYNNGDICQFIEDPNKFVKCFYNTNNKSLEFIFLGQKIRLSSEQIKMSEFNNYLFTLVRVPGTVTNSTDIEIIFDKNKKIILCLWYLGISNTTLSSIKSSSKYLKLNADIVLNNLYDDDKLNIKLNNSISTSLQNKKIFLSALNTKKDNVSNEKNITYEFTIDTNDNKIITYKKDTSIYYSENFDIENDNYVFIKDASTFKYQTNNNVKSYILNPTDDIISKNNVFNIETFKNTINNNFNVFIIENKNVEVIKNSINFNFIAPINLQESFKSLKLKDNENYYTYISYIQPEFVDVITFDNKNTLSINDKELDIYFNNLKIKNVNSIKQLWFNKVFDEINKNKLSFDYLSNVDVTRTCWDENFYIKYNNDDVTYVNGYIADKDVKTFFGSHGIVLKTNEITIEDWSKHQKIIKDDVNNNIVIELNITNALIDILLTKAKNNWVFTKEPNTGENYIRNLINAFYSINNKNIIKVYSRIKENDNVLSVFTDNNTFKEVNNVKMKNIEKENGNYILKLIVPIDNNEYAIKYIIEK